jgi:hypothetical protein
MDRLVHAFPPETDLALGRRDWEMALDVANLTGEVYGQNITDAVYSSIGYQAA